MTGFVVEDELWARETLRNMLPQISPSFQLVGEAANGLQAIPRILKLRPDLVFTDIRMPRMSGLDMISALRTEELPDTRFVVISAYADFELMRQALRLGVTDYLMKPFSLEDLAAVVLPLLSGKPIEPAPEPQIPTRHPVVAHALQIIRERYAERLSLDELSELLRLSPEYFSHVFHRDMGVNYSTYLREYRIERAKELLLSSDAPISKVGTQVGYSEAKYFCKVFKDVVGLSPTEYVRSQWIGP